MIDNKESPKVRGLSFKQRKLIVSGGVSPVEMGPSAANAVKGFKLSGDVKQERDLRPAALVPDPCIARQSAA